MSNTTFSSSFLMRRAQAEDSVLLCVMLTWTVFSTVLSGTVLVFTVYQAWSKNDETEILIEEDDNGKNTNSEEEPLLADIYKTMPEEYRIRNESKRNKIQQLRDVTQESGTVSLDEQRPLANFSNQCHGHRKQSVFQPQKTRKRSFFRTDSGVRADVLLKMMFMPEETSKINISRAKIKKLSAGALIQSTALTL